MRQCPRIVRTGFVAEQHLPALYSAASAFVYVSHYEGFGLPLLEAMSCGTPVIYGNNSSMPEIVKDAGLPADAADIDQIKTSLQRLLIDEQFNRQLVRRARRRAIEFHWEKTASQTLACYRDLLQGNWPIPRQGQESNHNETGDRHAA